MGAGRDAGTGALNRTQELPLKKKKGARNLQGLRHRRRIDALPDRRLQLVEFLPCAWLLTVEFR